MRERIDSAHSGRNVIDIYQHYAEPDSEENYREHPTVKSWEAIVFDDKLAGVRPGELIDIEDYFPQYRGFAFVIWGDRYGMYRLEGDGQIERINMAPCKKDQRVLALIQIPKTSTVYRWICPECNEAKETKAARDFVICGSCKLSFDTTGPLGLEPFENWTSSPPDAR